MSRITKEWHVALRYLLFSAFEVLRIASHLKKGGYDLVHVSGGSWQYKGVIAGKLAGIKVLWHLNDTSIPCFLQKTFRFFSRYADGYIFASERTKGYYAPVADKRKPQFVIPAPVDIVRFDPREGCLGDEDLLALWAGKIVVGTVANVNPVKGLETFIDAAAEANKVRKDLAFVVVGVTFRNQQGYYERLRQRCLSLGIDNLHFVGGRVDVRPLLQRFDIYVCSSVAESSPISVWEAMAMEKPVVSTNVGDVPVYLRDGQNGFVVEIGDSATLADNLLRLADDGPLRQAFGKKAREEVAGHLTLERVADLHEQAYRFTLGLRPEG